jgi:hypothetical protein
MRNALKWIVVPGNPGLYNIYLKYPMERMALDDDLIFYDMCRKHHLSSCQDNGLSNRRNGKTAKTVQTSYGAVDLVPLLCRGTYELI